MTQAAEITLDETPRGRPAAGQDPAKRKQILDGARAVFLRMGFDAASMNDITREAGVSKGTIYVYFANKEELFEALIEEERGDAFNNLYELLNKGDLRSSLIAFGVQLVTKLSSVRVVMAQRIVIGACERMPELGARFYQRGPYQGHNRMMAFLEGAVARGLLEIDDLDLAAYQLSDLMLAGVLRQRLFSFRPEPPQQDEIEHIVRSGVEVFLRAYGKRPA